MKINLFLLVVLIVIIKSNTKFFSYSALEGCSPSLSNEKLQSLLFDFSNKIHKNTFLVSDSQPCFNNNCRHWDETKKIAFCKALLIAKNLETDEFNLIKVKFQGSSSEEYSDFLFEIPSTNNLFNGFMKSKFPTKIVFRICIPVNRRNKTYVDLKCPHDICTTYGKINLIKNLQRNVKSNKVMVITPVFFKY